MVTLPVWATALCFPHRLTSNHSDQQCKGKMLNGGVGDPMISLMTGMSPCCQVSTVPPVIKSTAAKEQLERRALMAHLDRGVTEVSAATLHHPASSEPTSPPTSSSHRALLCVYLI
jgi:hypothetical protein